MKKGIGCFAFLAIVMLASLLISMPIVSAQTYSGFSKFVDNIKLLFASGDGKVRLALEIREKEINSAIENAKAGDNEDAVKNLESAKNKLKIVQERTYPDVAGEVRSNVEEAENRINENKNINTEAAKYFNEYLKEEEKTKLSADLSEKTFDYCKELASQNYDLMIKDEKCSSYSWMEEIVREKVEEERAGDIEKIKTEVSACMNNPKQCNCDEISLASEKANCEKYKASAVRCEFQGDSSACNEIEDIKEDNIKDETTREELEKEIMEKYLPAECSEAGVRDGEECRKLIITLNQPKTECMENGEYVGEEDCREKLVEEGNVVQECVVDGKLVDPSKCLNIVKEGNKPTGEEWELMSGECKERGVYDPEACEEIVNLPRPCKDAGYYTKKECETLTLNQNLPKECVDAGALTPEACEKLKLPSDCQGAYSREECDVIFIKNKMPPECQESETYDFSECAKILYSEVSDTSIESETEWLNSKGISASMIPEACLSDKSNFVRGMACDEALIKEFGVMLPPPVETSTIPKSCMRDGTPVSPEECQEILQGGIIEDAIPKACQDAEVTNPEDCAKLIEEQRLEQGIGINMPSECMGKSIEECKTIMQEKGIVIEKIEQVQRVEMVEKVEKMERMCKEGEVCEQEKEYEEITLPKECMEMGVGDVTDCNMVAGRINEERIKNGEKIIVDEKGEIDYINPEQVEKIADDSEKASQDVKPDFEKSEEIKQEINNIEDNMNQLGEANEQPTDRGDDMVERDSRGENIVEGGDRGDGGNVVDGGDSGSSGGEESSGGSESSDSGGDSGGSSGGESSGGGDVAVAGEVIGSGNNESPLSRILKRIFGI